MKSKSQIQFITRDELLRQLATTEKMFDCFCCLTPTPVKDGVEHKIRFGAGGFRLIVHTCPECVGIPKSNWRNEEIPCRCPTPNTVTVTQKELV